MDMPSTQEATAVITFLNFIIFFEILQICVTALFKIKYRYRGSWGRVSNDFCFDLCGDPYFLDKILRGVGVGVCVTLLTCISDHLLIQLTL
jgi:hypothetical protein